MLLGNGQAKRQRTEPPWLWLGLVAVLLLTLPAILPLAQPGLPATDDGLFHIGRLVELRQALAAGDLFPRWVQPFVEGLGFPFFNFYAPLSYYLALGLTFWGLTESDAFKLACAAMPLLAAVTMYGWIAQLLGSAGVAGRLRYVPALGAAMAYVYAPYQLVEVYRRGALAESFALALLPLLFLATDWLRRQPGLNSTLFVSVILGALVLTHNVLALLGLALVAGYLIFSAMAERNSGPRSPWPAFRCFALAVVLGLGLSAFFWLPATLERGYLTFEELSTGWFSIENHLADSWPPVQASLFFNFEDPFRLGLVQVLFFLLGLAPLVAGGSTLLGGKKGSKGLSSQAEPAVLWRGAVSLGAFFVLSIAVVMFLLSPTSAWLWRSVSLLKVMQFPWRTLGLLAFSSSFLTGLGLLWLGQRWTRLFPFFAVVLIVCLAVPSLVLLPTELAPTPPMNAGTIHTATSAAGWGLRSSQPPVAVTAAEAGALAQLQAVDQHPGWLNLKLEASRATNVVLHVLYFPGWRVFVDGQETKVFPATDRGLLAFAVPEGPHTVLARFEDTPLRTGANLLSILSTVLLALLLIFSVVRKRPATGGLVAAAILTGLFVFPHLTARPQPASEFHSVALAPSGGVRLLGAGLEQPRGEQVGVTLYWQALEPREDLESFVALVDEQGQALGLANHQPLYDAYPTTSWQTGEIVADRVELTQTLGFKGDPLELDAGFRPPDSTNSSASVSSFRIALAKPNQPSSDTPLRLSLGNRLGLAKYDLSSSIVSPGEDLQVGLLWRALDVIPGDLGVYLHLVDGKGEKMWAQDDWPPGPSYYPAVLWPIGQTVREERRLQVSPEAPPGRYTLRLGGYRHADLQDLPVSLAGQAVTQTNGVLSEVFVVAPDTRRNAAHPQTSLKASFGDQIELVGLDLSSGEVRPGQALTLTTYWRATRPLSNDYTIFAQILDPSGALLGQLDSQPANGSYPTSFWQPGEYVVDTRTIKINTASSAGTYRLALGLYSWPTLERLAATVDGKSVGTAVELGPSSSS